MTYWVALVLSIAVCAQTVAIALVMGNTEHVRNGRKPDASVSLLPMIPMYQLIALGLAWLLERMAPDAAIPVLLAVYALLLVGWAASFRRAKVEYVRVLAQSQKAASLP